MSAKEKAVLISDVHFSTKNLALALASMKQALAKAEELGVPLIDCGDLLDEKAIIRAECANALIALFSKAKTRIILVVGNHTLVNVHSKDHSLNFLRPYAEIVDAPRYDDSLDIHFLPYFHDDNALKAAVAEIPPGSTIIMHQGVVGAFMGDYVQDKSSLDRDSFSDFRVISGHYHRHQDIQTGRPRKGAVGLFTYVGNPYSLSFGEANDGPKGFQLLNSDGSLTQVRTNLRKHIILEMTFGKNELFAKPAPGDLVWVKYTGTAAELATVDKKQLGERLGIGQNYKLDLIKTDAPQLEAKTEGLTDEGVLEALIASSGESKEQQEYLLKLWKEELA